MKDNTLRINSSRQSCYIAGPPTSVIPSGTSGFTSHSFLCSSLTSDEDEDAAFYELYLYRDTTSYPLSSQPDLNTHFDTRNVVHGSAITNDAPGTHEDLAIKDSVCLICEGSRK